jgi:hypothetical protein
MQIDSGDDFAFVAKAAVANYAKDNVKATVSLYWLV